LPNLFTALEKVEGERREGKGRGGQATKEGTPYVDGVDFVPLQNFLRMPMALSLHPH